MSLTILQPQAGNAVAHSVPAPVAAEFVGALRPRLRGEVRSDAISRGIHATDASHYQIVPLAVAWPLDEADVLAALEVARLHRVPVTLRGAATSLSGQTHGRGLVLDTSRHLHRVLEVDAEHLRARVQPGVVLQQLNQQLAPNHLLFPPDPATASRATIGGLLGNNSSGTRSLRWGKTSDNVVALRVALVDGTVLELERHDEASWRAKEELPTREGELYRTVDALVRDHAEEIEARFPKVMRRVAGYALDALLPSRPTRSLADLVIGSEGTLAVVLEATLRLVRRPAATAVCVVHFDDVVESLRALPRMLEFDPLAIEMLDDVILREALVNAASARHAGFFVGNPRAIQIVELDAPTPTEVRRAARQFAAAMRSEGIGSACSVLLSHSEQQDAWEVRRLGLGLISNVKGPRKGQAFVEDACVPVEHLAPYVERVLALCRREGVPVSVYGHASVGVLHIRPMLDLHQGEQIQAMRRIATECFAWVREFGGVFSGEHGDGLVRGEFLAPFFGERLTACFASLKQAFDPEGLLNPGKMVAPEPMTKNLRYQIPGYAAASEQAESAAAFRYAEQGGFALAVEQCNGVGACRKIGSGAMCPSYMALREEAHCTRGRANALRLAMSGQLGDPLEALASDELHATLELCLSCKACKAECPNAVDLARLKMDALAMRWRARGIPLGVRAIGALPGAARRIAGPLAPLVNAVQRSVLFRHLVQPRLGLDSARTLPAFARRPLRQPRRAALRSGARSAARGTVVLFADTASRFYEPQVALSAQRLLERLGYEVHLSFAGDSQRPRLSKGLLEQARREARVVYGKLAEAVQEAERAEVARRGSVGPGAILVPILCLEPSDASALVDDLPDLLPADLEPVTLVASRIRLFDEFLLAHEERLRALAPTLFWHRHCHERAVFAAATPQRLGEAHVIDSGAGCCGMAGSFGYEHGALSRQIAEDRLLPHLRRALEVHEDQLIVVANGFSCRHQIRDFAADELGEVPVVHLSEAVEVVTS